MPEVLVIEPFYGGSHKQLIDLINQEFGEHCTIFTLSDKKWHWRARTSAFHFSVVIPRDKNYDNFVFHFSKLFCTSTLNLTELLGLRPDLARIPSKIIYFHENQLVYPVNREKSRYDFQYGYMQILSCLCADLILYNSVFNMRSFLDKIDSFLNIIPIDSRPKGIAKTLESKGQVLYYPMVYPAVNNATMKKEDILRIVWPHRWEHDKRPELFFDQLFKLKAENFDFEVVVLGESYEEKPDVFQRAQKELNDRIVHWGFANRKSDYYDLLKACHVAVSTAKHEFFGVSMLEAAHLDCFPLCPNNLAYPEIYPKQCLYNSEAQLYKLLRNFCKNPKLATEKRRKVDIKFEKYDWKLLKT
uniref:tRNA-queuosine alpha-mannosyltransferase n=1 Tax=Romanomermis culicivorax TaxID=13658 RepID=A0A915ILW8_ROMCU